MEVCVRLADQPGLFGVDQVQQSGQQMLHRYVRIPMASPLPSNHLLLPSFRKLLMDTKIKNISLTMIKKMQRIG